MPISLNKTAHQEAAFSNLRIGNSRLSTLIFCIILFLIAFAVRWPKLFEIPRFRSNELDITLKLVRGEAFPLINQHSHIGALSNYIHALGFWALGMHFWVPGLLTALAGSATVFILYLWGRRVVHPIVALLAALLLSCSLYHVYFLSHVPWSNCLTPFFTGLMLLCFFKALQESSVRYFVTSAFLFGLAFQTHPSVVTLIPALFVLFLLQGKERARNWIRRPAFYLTIPAVILSCSNLIVYHLFVPDHRAAAPLAYTTKYALEEKISLSSYIANSGKAWTLLLRLVSAQVDTKPHIEHWKNPVLLGCAFCLLLGIVFALRKQKYELPLLLLTPMLLIPAFNRIYGFCNFGRYEGFILPMALLLIAFALKELLSAATGRVRTIGIPLVAACLIGLVSYHLYQLTRVYSVLRVQESSMIFMKTREMLAKSKFDKKKSVVLIDAFSWHENQMKPFLLSDGWTVDRLTETDTINVKARNFLKPKFASLPAQVRKYQRRGNADILVLASPLILKPLLSSGYIASYEANISAAKIDRPNNLYILLISHIYYLLSATSHQTSSTDSAPSLEPLLNAAPYIPEDLYRALPGNRKGGALQNPADMPSETFKVLRALLQSTSIPLPDYPIVKSAICHPEPP